MAETITLQGKKAQLSNARGPKNAISIGEFARGISDASIQGLDDEPLPDNVRWRVRCNRLDIFLVELTPVVRLFNWLSDDSPAPFGAAATYTERKLATPYIVLKIPFRDKTLVERIEIFYRAAPLSSLEGEGGELFFTNLYNVSPHSHSCISWYCSQYLPHALPPGYKPAIDEVIHHLVSGGFNRSSTYAEGLCSMELCQKEGVDPRVTDVKRWERESKKNPRFVLDVAWKTTGVTVRQLIEKELAIHRVKAVPDSTATLGNILLRRTKPK